MECVTINKDLIDMSKQEVIIKSPTVFGKNFSNANDDLKISIEYPKTIDNDWLDEF
mgnify:CR=1 FL=1